MRGHSSDRLQSATRLAIDGLGMLVLLACAALAIATTVSRRQAKQAIAVNDTLRAVEAIRINLSKLGQQAALADVTRQAAYELATLRDEGELAASLTRARSLLQRPAQRALLETAERQIDQYLLVRKQAEARNQPSRDVIAASQPQLQAALDTLDELSRVGFDQTSTAERRFLRAEGIENGLGLAIAAVVVFGFGAITLVLRRRVFAPLIAL